MFGRSQAPKHDDNAIRMYLCSVCSSMKSINIVAYGFSPSGNCKRMVLGFLLSIVSTILFSSRLYFLFNSSIVFIIFCICESL